MKFRVFEEGCQKDGQEIDVVSSDKNPRARAAAMFCARDPYRYPGVDTVNVMVCPADEEAQKLDGWKGGDEADPRPYVAIKLRPTRTIVWRAVQVHGFNEYGAHGVSHGVVVDGECFTMEVG
jgi:hypothetical protein